MDPSLLSKLEKELVEKLHSENQEALANLQQKSQGSSLGFKLDLLFYLIMFLVIYGALNWWKWDFGLKVTPA